MFTPLTFIQLEQKNGGSFYKLIKKKKIELVFDFCFNNTTNTKSISLPYPIIINMEVKRFLSHSKNENCDNFLEIEKTSRSMEYIKLLDFVEKGIEGNFPLAIVIDADCKESNHLMNMLNDDLIRRGYETRKEKYPE